MLRGVNLGGWLVLERWLTPSLFEGRDARDEMTLCVQYGSAAIDMLRMHRQKFITLEDFNWLAERGVNAVRIPVGCWIFGDMPPYAGGIEFLDRAFSWAEATGMKVLIDLHGAPGSQNGAAHSGSLGNVEWHTKVEYSEASLRVIERLAERYKESQNLWGIELLNEPSAVIPERILLDFYRAGYEAVRKVCGARVAVVMSDRFQPYAWQDKLADGRYENAVQDTHLYQAFGYFDARLDIEQYITKTVDEWPRIIREVRRSKPLIVGEWSLGVGGSAYKSGGMFLNEVAARAYGAAQLTVFERADGWFFWTYKKEAQDHWNFRHCLEQGWLPPHF